MQLVTKRLKRAQFSTLDSKTTKRPKISLWPCQRYTYRVVYDQNLVSVSATETMIKFRYRFRCQNFFCLNFPPFSFLDIISPKMLCCLVQKTHWYRLISLVSCQLPDFFCKMPNYLPYGYLCPRKIGSDMCILFVLLTKAPISQFL